MEEKENIIYYPPETPEQKQAAKDREEQYRKYRDRRKSDERQPLSLSEEERKKIIAAAEKIRKESRGIRKGNFEKWWFGREKREWEKVETIEREAEEEQRGGAGLAKWVFDQLALIGGTFWTIQKENLAMPNGKLFSETVEPSVKRLTKEVVEYGAQEDLRNYFWDRLAFSAQNPRAAKEVWKIWQKYLEEASEGPV